MRFDKIIWNKYSYTITVWNDAILREMTRENSKNNIDIYKKKNAFDKIYIEIHYYTL